MVGKVHERLRHRGITLPPVAKPQANYQPWKRIGAWVFISGQLPIQISGQLPIQNKTILHPGRVGETIDIKQGREAAGLAALHVLACLEQACENDLDRVKECVRLVGYVACGSGFTDQPKVIDGASEIMVWAFDAAGRHTRAAVGVASLPLGAAVEVEAMFTYRT